MKRDAIVVPISIGLVYCIMIFVLLFFGEINIHTIFLCIYLIIIGIFAVGKTRDRMLGLPTEDELSKKIKQKAAMYSFYSSMVMWILIVIINDIMKLNPREMMNVGVYGMLTLFGIFWLYFRFIGKFNE